MIQVDEVETKLDSLILSLFEAMRLEPNSSNAKSAADNLKNQFEVLNNCIDNLVGITVSNEKQEEVFSTLIHQNNEARCRIISLEDELHKLRYAVDTKILDVSEKINYLLF